MYMYIDIGVLLTNAGFLKEEGCYYVAWGMRRVFKGSGFRV